MPGFLYNEQPVNIPVYQHPLDLMGRALMVKDAKVHEGLSMIKSQYDNLLNTPMTNEYNRMGLRNDTEKSMNQLKGLSSVDLSLPENQGAAMGVFDNVLNNKNYLIDIAFTRNLNKQKGIIDAVKKGKPELWSPQNEHQVTKAENEYRMADPDKMLPRFVEYQPYKDVDKMMGEIAKSVEEDEGQDEGPRKVGEDVLWTSHDVKLKSQQKIMDRLSAAMQVDPSIAAQMGINYDYLKDLGSINPESISSTIQSKIDYIKAQINDPHASVDDAKTGNEMINNYNKLLGQIKSDPESAFEVYGPNAWAHDQLTSIANGYAFKKIGKTEYDPASFEMFKNKLDMQKIAFTSQLKIKEEQAKGGLSAMFTLPPNDPASWGYNPYISVLDKLGKDGYISLPSDDPLPEVLLGNPAKNKEGGYTMYRANNGSDDPSKAPLLSVPGVDLNQDEMKKVSISLVLDNFARDIERKDPGLFKYKIKDILGMSGEQRAMDSPERLAKAMDVFKVGNPRYDSIISKYAPMLAKLGIDVSDSGSAIKAIEEYKAYVSNPENTTKITTGITMNSLQGKFNFVPAGDGRTVQVGDNGQAYVRGTVEIPAEAMSPDVLRYMKTTGMGTAIIQSKTDDNDPKKSKTYYIFDAKMPSNVDLTEAGLSYLEKKGDKDMLAHSPYYRDQIGSYLATTLSNNTFDQNKDEHGNISFTLKHDSDIGNDLTGVSDKLNYQKNNGLIPIDNYKDANNTLRALMNDKYASRAEAMQKINAFMRNLGPSIRPTQQSEKGTQDAVKAIQESINNPMLHTIRGKLIDNGFSPSAASYWIGNFLQESGLKSGVTNNIGAYGLAQWLGPRREDLEKFAHKQGKQASDVDVQIQFLMKELKDNGVLDKARSTDVNEVVSTIKGYERYEGWNQPDGGSEEGNRFFYGSQLDQYFNQK